MKEITTKMKYGWSKYGGARMGIVRKETVWSDEWVCQACGKTQVKELPHYMIPFEGSDREFIQICSWCKSQAVKHGASDHRKIISIIRKSSN